MGRRTFLRRPHIPWRRLGVYPGEGWSPRVRIAILGFLIIGGMLAGYLIYQDGQHQDLNVVVVDSTGNPISLARVDVNCPVVLETAPDCRYFTDANGAVGIGGLAWGHMVDLDIEDSAYLPYTTRLGPGSFDPSLRVTLYRPSAISGQLLGNDGVALVNGEIRIDELNLQTFARADGTFDFANVPPGDYTLIYDRDGLTGSQQITLPAETQLELTLVIGAPPSPSPNVEPTPFASAEPTPSASAVEPTPSASAEPTPSILSSSPPNSNATTFTYTSLAGDSLLSISNHFNAQLVEVYRLNPSLQAQIEDIPTGSAVVVPCTNLAIAEGYSCKLP